MALKKYRFYRFEIETYNYMNTDYYVLSLLKCDKNADSPKNNSILHESCSFRDHDRINPAIQNLIKLYKIKEDLLHTHIKIIKIDYIVYNFETGLINNPVK